MMATTHVFVGLAIASGVALVVPEYAAAAAVGAVIGGLLPDFDVVAIHRKTLHFPVYYTVLSIPAAVLALVVPTGWTIGLAVGLLAAAVHSCSDVLGGGPTPRPWAAPSSKAVYAHPFGCWLRPRRWIRYDGAPEDFLFGLAVSVPVVLVYGDSWLVQLLVSAGLVVSLVYTTFRKPIGRHVDGTADR
jgi:hypothetical protein